MQEWKNKKIWYYEYGKKRSKRGAKEDITVFKKGRRILEDELKIKGGKRERKKYRERLNKIKY